MGNATRVAVAIAMTLGLIAVATSCSNNSDPVDPVLWHHVENAENRIYGIKTDPTTSMPDPATLLDRVSAVAVSWDGSEPPVFTDDAGTAVFYNFATAEHQDEASFDLFFASGVNEHALAGAWLLSAPRRVYTCYRIDAAFEGGNLQSFHRSFADTAAKLECPSVLVSALGDGAQYREPASFDG